MNTQENVIEINTLEEFTTHCLGRSLEGLEELRRDSIHCGDTLLLNQPKGLTQFATLCEALRDFYVFEGDIRTLFLLDTDLLGDRQGTLKETEMLFEDLLNSMPALLTDTEVPVLAEHLKTTLPGIIDRFQDLLPTLKNYIEDEYINYEK